MGIHVSKLIKLYIFKMWSLFSANYTSIKRFKTTVTQKLYPPAHNSACWHANLTLSSPRSIQGKGYLTHASAREVTPWPRGLATVLKKKKLYCKILFCTATTVWVGEGFSQLFSFSNFHFHFTFNLQLKIFITFLDPRSMASQPQQLTGTT